MSLSPAVRVVVLDAFTGGSAQNDLGTTENHFTFADATHDPPRPACLEGRVRDPRLEPARVRRTDQPRRHLHVRVAGRIRRRAATVFHAAARGRALVVPAEGLRRSSSRIRSRSRRRCRSAPASATTGRTSSPTPTTWRRARRSPGRCRSPPSCAAAPGGSTTAPAAGRSGRSCARATTGCSATGCCDPPYPDPFAGGGMRHAAAARSRHPRAPDPHPLHRAVQRRHRAEVRKGTTLTATYIGSRGVDLFRSRDVNAPPPPLYLARPDATLGQVRQIEATGRQTLHSLQLTASGRFTRKVQGTVQYTLGSALQRHERHHRAARQQLRPGERMGPRRLRSAASPRGARASSTWAGG